MFQVLPSPVFRLEALMLADQLAPLGKLYEAPQLLRDMAATGRGFYPAAGAAQAA